MGMGPGARHAVGADAPVAGTDCALAMGCATPAVTIAVAKQEGENAVDIAERVVARFGQLQGTFIPDGVEVSITRNYGETADYKAQKLITNRLARIAHCRRRGHRHAGADAVRELGLGLHAEPRVAVRAHLLHRHPGG